MKSINLPLLLLSLHPYLDLYPRKNRYMARIAKAAAKSVGKEFDP